jgi:CHAD domain-containing protein
MAKARDIKTTPWEPYARAAARIVRVRTRELFDQADGVLDTDDIERVHDMRVASRRLRAVLEIFAPCFPKAEFTSVLGDVKRLADALGERRDPDVHIAAMDAFAERQPAVNRPGIQRLTEELRRRQAAGNEALAAELRRAEERGLHDRLLALSDAAEETLRGEQAAADAVEAAETDARQATPPEPPSDGVAVEGVIVAVAEPAPAESADGAGEEEPA